MNSLTGANTVDSSGSPTLQATSNNTTRRDGSSLTLYRRSSPLLSKDGSVTPTNQHSLCQVLIDYEDKSFQSKLLAVHWANKWFRIITDIDNNLIHVSRLPSNANTPTLHATLQAAEGSTVEIQNRRNLDGLMEALTKSLHSILSISQTGDVMAGTTSQPTGAHDQSGSTPMGCLTSSFEKIHYTQSVLCKAWNYETEMKVQLLFLLQRDFAFPLKIFFDSELKPVTDALATFEKKRVKLLQAHLRLCEMEDGVSIDNLTKKERQLKKLHKKVDERRTQCEMEFPALRRNLQRMTHQMVAFFTIVSTDVLDMQLNYHKQCLRGWNETILALHDT